MRLAVISDIHLGDSSSTMAVQESSGNKTGKGYERFVDTIREQFDGEPLDYLVLLGDILDFSIKHYSAAYSIAGTLFGRMIEDGLLRKRTNKEGKTKFGPVIYVPGNHDLDMWHTVEYQVNIILRLNRGKGPEKLRMSVPTIIHERPDGSGSDVYLHGVSDIKKRKYGDLFLDFITAPPIDFYFGFPNLYFVAEGETVMMTHGQYFNFFWSFLGQWALKIFGTDLKLRRSGQLDLVEMVGINHPTGQLSCSAIGQAGPLTGIVRRLEHDIKAHELGEVDKYVDGLLGELFTRINSGLLSNRCVQRAARAIVKRIVLRLLGNTKSARDYDQYLQDPDIKVNFNEFYKATIHEIEHVKSTYPFDIPYPSRMIFGHTHRPISWDAPSKVDASASSKAMAKQLLVCNTGGWLHHADGKGPGAEVFFYETGKGFSSKRVHYEPSTEAG